MPTPSIIQQAQTSNGADVTLTGVTAGNVLLNSVSAYNATATVSGVSGGGTWAQVPGVYFTGTAGVVAANGDMWICSSATGGSTTATVTWTGGLNDHNWLIELSAGTALDTAATGAAFSGTTLPAVPCADAGAVLFVDSQVGGNPGAVLSPWTSGGTPNQNPTGYYFPGAAGSYSATVASSAGQSTGWGASFVLRADSPPRYNVARGGLEDILREGILSNIELRSVAAWF